MAKQALDFKGHVDILINNGGIGHLGSADEMNQIEKQVMEVNFWAAVALTKAVLLHMLSRHRTNLDCFKHLRLFWQPQIGSLCSK